MVIDFQDNETKRICNEDSYAKRKFPPNVVKTLQMLLIKLASYEEITVFFKPPLKDKYNVHVLHGDKKGIISFTLDFKRRLTLKLHNKNGVIILEVSNHYGD